MSDFVFNIAKGRVAELYNRVKTNDPANSALILVPIARGATTDATLVDKDTLADVLAVSTELTTGGWSRKTLTDLDLVTLVPDKVLDRIGCDFADQTWVAVTGSASTDFLVCYDSDTTAGTDANIIPLTCHSFAFTPNGTDIVAVVNDFFQAR